MPDQDLDSLNPVFNEVFTLPLDHVVRNLRFNLFDYDVLGSNDSPCPLLIDTMFPRIFARTYYAHPRARVIFFSAPSSSHEKETHPSASHPPRFPSMASSPSHSSIRSSLGPSYSERCCVLKALPHSPPPHLPSPHPSPPPLPAGARHQGTAGQIRRFPRGRRDATMMQCVSRAAAGGQHACDIRRTAD